MQSECYAEPWLALRTKSRHEAVVEAALRQREVVSYLPKRKVHRGASASRASVEAPLFPGYVFVRPRPSQFASMRYVRGSCGLVLAGGQPAVLPERDMAAVRILAESAEPYDVGPELLVGTRVRIIAGPLAGAQGELVRIRNQDVVVINLEAVCSSVRVDIDRSVVVAC